MQRISTYIASTGTVRWKTAVVVVALTVAWTPLAMAASLLPQVGVGADNNSADNPFIQPEGAPDQSLQFGDALRGKTMRDDVLIGRRGTDVLLGGLGDDVLIGGTEHFHPVNRDRAFGGFGVDMFLWAPGDGSDFFTGGRDWDALVFGLMGEIQDGEVVFDVERDEQPGEIFLDPQTNLPRMDVATSPGFCCVIDPSGPQTDRHCITNATPNDAATELDALGLDHLVQFILRNGPGPDDDALAVTLHVRSVEVLVCTNEAGGAMEVFDLRQSPPTAISLDQVPSRTLRERLQQIIAYE
jgi:hypothetical protein